MKERKVFIEFDFRSGQISFGEDWCGTGQSIDEYHGLARRYDIGKYLTIDDQEELEASISAEQRAEFASLCEKEFTIDFSSGNTRGIVDDPLNSFVMALCREICDEHEYAQSNNRALNGLLNIVDAHDILDKSSVLEYGLTVYSTDNAIEKLAEKIEEDQKLEYQQSMHHTEQCLRDYRVALREDYEKKIQWIVTDDSNILGSFNDFDSAMDVAQELAEEQATPEERETLERWGDDMATGWGICPVNDTGGYWPQVHCAHKGKRIERLPWERG